MVKSTRKSRKEYFICPQCKMIGYGKNHMPGNRITEILLWVLLFFPGPVYSAWRHCNQTLRCFKCDNPDIIALNSIKGEKLFKQSLTEPNTSKAEN